MLDEPRRPAVPADGGNASSESASSPCSAWADSARKLVADGIAAGTCDQHRANVNLAAADFAERNNCVPVTDSAIDLWGYGEVPVNFACPDGNAWLALHTLIKPTGVPFTVLRQEFIRDLNDDYGDVDVLTWRGHAGELDRLEMVKTSFAMRIFLGSSPWAAEFQKAMFATFRRAMIGSGLGDALGPVTRIRADGTTEQTGMTFGEFMAGGEPLPTEEEARAQAFRGPVIL